MRYTSPLRYPGGKSALTTFLAETIRINGLVGGTYIEPFAGGAGAALRLLFAELVSNICINDKDPCIYNFWRAVVEHTDGFTRLVWHTPVTVEEWQRQRSVLRSPKTHSALEVGFATFYVNRCNHSGVLNGGPIGRLDQSGDYKIGARFNKRELVKRIERIGLNSHRIHVSNEDGTFFLSRIFAENGLDQNRALVYMDPPYYKKGHRLYAFYFHDQDHEALSTFLQPGTPYRWILSCDNAALIRRLYKGKLRSIRLNYCAHTAKIGRELIIHSANCLVPRRLVRFRPSHRLLPELSLCHALP